MPKKKVELGKSYILHYPKDPTVNYRMVQVMEIEPSDADIDILTVRCQLEKPIGSDSWGPPDPKSPFNIPGVIDEDQLWEQMAKVAWATGPGWRNQ